MVANALSDPKLEFLETFCTWLDKCGSDKFAKRLTPHTHGALSHTPYGLLEVVKYCCEELKLNYVLLGKFQTDFLEDRFGKYLAGGHHIQHFC